MSLGTGLAATAPVLQRSAPGPLLRLPAPVQQAAPSALEAALAAHARARHWPPRARWPSWTGAQGGARTARHVVLVLDALLVRGAGCGLVLQPHLAVLAPEHGVGLPELHQQEACQPQDAPTGPVSGRAACTPPSWLLEPPGRPSRGLWAKPWCVWGTFWARRPAQPALQLSQPWLALLVAPQAALRPWGCWPQQAALLRLARLSEAKQWPSAPAQSLQALGRAGRRWAGRSWPTWTTRGRAMCASTAGELLGVWLATAGRRLLGVPAGAADRVAAQVSHSRPECAGLGGVSQPHRLWPAQVCALAASLLGGSAASSVPGGALPSPIPSCVPPRPRRTPGAGTWARSRPQSFSGAA